MGPMQMVKCKSISTGRGLCWLCLDSSEKKREGKKKKKQV